MTERLEIVCIATRRLDGPMPTIVQHLMRALASRVRVLYVEPSVDPIFLARGPGWRMLRPTPGPDQLARIVPLVLPFEPRLPSLAPLNRRVVIAQVGLGLRRWRQARCVLWLPTPRFAWLADAFPDLPVCYYVSDDYAQSPSALAGTAPETLTRLETRVLERATWILVNSPELVASRRTPGRRTFWVPSGVDVTHFRSAAEPHTVPGDLTAIRRPIAGFVGAVDDYKLDFALLEACAQSLPEVSFVTVGPVGWGLQGRAERLPTGPNIHHLGLRPYASLPSYLRGFDVALLPNRTTGYMAANFPMKLFEYFAAGLPVVATDIPAIRPFARWVRVGREPHEFGLQIRAALETCDDQVRKDAFEVAARNSWDRQAERVLDILRGGSPEPVLPFVPASAE